MNINDLVVIGLVTLVLWLLWAIVQEFKLIYRSWRYYL